MGTTMSAPFRDDLWGKMHLQRAGVREGSKLLSVSAAHPVVSGSFALLSALAQRAGKNLTVKKREIKLKDQTAGKGFKICQAAAGKGVITDLLS